MTVGSTAPIHVKLELCTISQTELEFSDGWLGMCYYCASLPPSPPPSLTDAECQAKEERMAYPLSRDTLYRERAALYKLISVPQINLPDRTHDSLSADDYTTAAVSAHKHKPSDLGPRRNVTSMSGLPHYTPKSIDTQANSAPTYSAEIHRIFTKLPSTSTGLTNSSVPASSSVTYVTAEDERRRFLLAQAAQNKRGNLPQPVKTVVNDQGPMVSTESEEVPVNTVGGGSSHARNNSDLKPLSKSGGLKSSCPALFTDDTSRFLEAISPKPVNPVHVTFADHPYPPRLPAKSVPILPKSSFIRLRPELRGQSSAVAPPPPPLVQASAGGNNIVTHSKETELLGRQYETHMENLSRSTSTPASTALEQKNQTQQAREAGKRTEKYSRRFMRKKFKTQPTISVPSVSRSSVSVTVNPNSLDDPVAGCNVSNIQ